MAAVTTLIMDNSSDDDNAAPVVRRLVHQDSKRLAHRRNTVGSESSGEFVTDDDDGDEYDDADDAPPIVRRLDHSDSLRMVRMKGIENDIDLAGCKMGSSQNDMEYDGTEDDDEETEAEETSVSASDTDLENAPVPVRRMVHRDSKRILTESIHKKKEDVEFLRALAAELQEEDEQEERQEAIKLPPPVVRRRTSFGIAPFPNMNVKTVELKGRKSAAAPRPTTRLVWNEDVEWEYIENFRFALKKREKAQVWFSDNEMIMIQVEFLDEQQAMERRQAQKDKHQKEASTKLEGKRSKEKKKKKKKRDSSYDALSSNHVDRRVFPAKKKSGGGGRRGLMKKAKSISNFFLSKENKRPQDDISVSRCGGDKRNNFSRSSSAKF